MRIFSTLCGFVCLLFLLIGCAGEQATEPGDGLQVLTDVQGAGPDLKGDAPNAVSRWQILQSDDEQTVFRAFDGTDEVYFEAWIRRDAATTRVEFTAPVQCDVVTDTVLGVELESSCTFEQSAILGLTAVDFMGDLQASNQALAVEQKADGIASGVCATAEVVMGGLGGLVATVLIFHEQIFASVFIGTFGGTLGLSVAGVSAAAAVFALGAVGTAWAVDLSCNALGIEGNQAALAACVDECDDDDGQCIGGCVTTAVSEEGRAIGREECSTRCDDDMACSSNCDEAWASTDRLRQTLLVQCAMGCGEGSEVCAQSCIDVINEALPLDPQ